LEESDLMRGINESFGSPSDEFVQYATAEVLGCYSKTRVGFHERRTSFSPLVSGRSQPWDWLREKTPHAEKAIDGLPLGLIPGTDYTQTVVRLGLEDLVILYTDGISEAVNEQEQELGYEGLMGLARSLPVDSPARTGPALLDVVERFPGLARPFDDRSILVLQQSDSPKP
jgi:hypothetical protein